MRMCRVYLTKIFIKSSKYMKINQLNNHLAVVVVVVVFERNLQ